MNILSIMRDGPVIPVIVIDRLEDAVPLARALVAGAFESNRGGGSLCSGRAGRLCGGDRP